MNVPTTKTIYLANFTRSEIVIKKGAFLLPILKYWNVSKCVMLATCRSGPDLQIAHPSSDLNRFYENFSYELFFAPLSDEDKKRIADKSGLSLTLDQAYNAPTPGWIVMSDARNTMETRLQSLSQEARNTLYALKLLREAGIGPPTHQRVKSVLITIFQYEESIRLLAMLEELSKNAFIKPPSIRDPIRPEEAYLDKVVTYIDGKNPRDDFNALSTTLINIKDAEGLHYLAITLSMSGEYSKAYSHLEQAVAFKDNFYEAWYTMGLICYEVGNKLDTKNQPGHRRNTVIQISNSKL